MTQGVHPVLCDNLEGWDGVGDGREVQERGAIIPSETLTYLA